MAGDWIKFEIGTSDKPEVWAIAHDLNIDPDAVVGKLLRVWSWFDQHTENGNALTVTKMLLDRVVGVTGFCNSLITVGWMIESDGYIEIPNFDRHNDKTAKSRATTAKRVASFKEKKRSGNEESNGASVTGALPREEKRREDISNANALDSFCSEPEVSKPPADHSPVFIFIPTNKFNTSGEQHPVTENQISDWIIAYPAVDVRRVLAQIRSWSTNNPAKRKTVKGMNRFIDSWLAREQNSGGNGHAANQQHRVAGTGASKPSPADLVRAQARQALECVDREIGDPGVHPNGGSVWPQSH